ncbi:MAG: tRNA epoxyqueuosine(34) reductase QueG [Alphaproteobacteria bacterium]|nr:tRNA epoxyqueuosine(34) reductase QueG [Alphaproteobacteria bacterium]
MAGEEIKSAIRERALGLGFDSIGFAPAELDPKVGQRLDAFLSQGCHGDMGWMPEKAARRRDPSALWPEARSVIVLGMNYGPDGDPLAVLKKTDRGAISVYAQPRDYHDIVKGRLKQLGGWLQSRYGGELKVFVDTAPVMEKPLAAAAGVGWQGKHTNLVSREFGSWLFLGEIFTTLEIPPDHPHEDACGGCRRCLDICPTDAFPAPYRLDARRCISYLTIEHKGHIAPEFRVPMGNRIFGCDDCLAVCPWNKFAKTTAQNALEPRAALTAPRLSELAGLDDSGFRKLFSGSPIKRLGRDRFVRNVLIALGNSGNTKAGAAAAALLADPSPLVRAMAVWALARLLDSAAFTGLRGRHLPGEDDPAVRQEWTNA